MGIIGIRRAIIDISHAKDFYTPQTSRYIVVERGVLLTILYEKGELA